MAIIKDKDGKPIGIVSTGPGVYGLPPDAKKKKPNAKKIKTLQDLADRLKELEAEGNLPQLSPDPRKK